MKKFLFAATALAATLSASVASADISLVLVDSYARSAPFGVAFDGTNVWWSDGFGVVHEMTTGGVDTGKTANGPYWSALAYNEANQKLVEMQSGSITQFDRPNAANMSYADLNPVTTAIAGGYGGLIDGLDVQGGTLWWSPDVDRVFHSPVDGSGSATEFLGDGQLAVGASNYVVVVNDANSPRQLCVHDMSAVQLGCTSLPNSRYEDIAFDGRYLWAADYYGYRIDKIDLLGGGGGSILDPNGGVPEPASWALMIVGFGGVGATLRRRRSLPTAA